jgi:deoxyadenosine/deoxycytidine kinase
VRNGRYYITVAGNIGVGKSTLVGILAEEFDWQPYYELVADHPYLEDYYRDRERWGFHSQIWFLTQRYQQHLEIADTPISVCQDRSTWHGTGTLRTITVRFVIIPSSWCIS